MKNIGIAIRSLFKRGQHNVMKIISLGIGLTIGLVLIAKVHFENTYDNFYPDGDRIYRVYEKFFMNGEVGDHGQTPAGVIPLLKQETPEIEAATRYTRRQSLHGHGRMAQRHELDGGGEHQGQAPRYFPTEP